MLTSALRTLVIGDVDRWSKHGPGLPDVTGLKFVSLDEVTAELLDRFCPDLILSPLMQADFDATDVAAHLSDLGYTGRYRAIGDDLPNVDMIAKDVRSAAPGIDVDVISLPKGQLSNLKPS